jgi:hypothetical protein
MEEADPIWPEDPEEELPPIPSVLDSEFEEGPFTKCIACDRPLREDETLYQIQKTWKRGQVVFEIALCANCFLRVQKDFSAESMERMHKYLVENYRPSESLSFCHFCRTAVVEENSEYEIAGLCTGIFLARPLVVMCSACSSKVQEQLSRKTRDAWGEFMHDNVPGVPMEMEPDNIPMTF